MFSKSRFLKKFFEIISLMVLAVLFSGCLVEEGGQSGAVGSTQNTTITSNDSSEITEDENQEDDTDLSEDSENEDLEENPELVSLTVSLGEPANLNSRSISRTAIGTFEEIQDLYINAQRSGRNSFIYESPGSPLTKTNSFKWTGVLDGLIVNETYTFSVLAMNSSGVVIFTGFASHTVEAQGGDNTINISLNPVLNNAELSVPVITKVKIKETVGKNDNTTVITSVQNLDNGSLNWVYESYTLDSFGFANRCGVSCGYFTPESSKSVVAGESVTLLDGKYVHEISSIYSAPDNVSEQNLRFIVSNKSGIGIEARFSIKVTGPVNSEISTKAAPAILNITAFRVQDNTTCPAYDCLALEAVVDDDDLFSNLSASWRYSLDSNKFFQDNSSQVSDSDNTQGRFRTIFKEYKDSDNGVISLTVRDNTNLEALLSYPLTQNSYPLVPVCDSSGNDCVVPRLYGYWDQITWDNVLFGE